MTSDHRDAVFSIDSPDHEGGGAGDGGESDTDDDVALPETNDDLNSPYNVTVALPSGSAVPVSAIPADSSPKWRRATEIVHRRQQQPPPPPPPAIDDSRRLFQRLWTDEDEIELLRGFLDYVTTHRGGSNPPDTAPFYEMIKSKLQFEFNKNQLVEKLRRLKKKYRNVMSKFGSGKEVLFKSPHDQSTFEISRKIWNRTGKIIGFEMDFEEANVNDNSPGSNPSAAVEIESENGVEKKGWRKRSRSRIGKIEEDNNVNLNETVSASIGGLIEETVRSCVSSLIKEMMNGTTSMMMAAMGGGGGGGGSLSPVFPRTFGGGGSKAVRDERWRKQQILELEVYSRRLELVQEEIRATLHELKTMPSGV